MAEKYSADLLRVVIAQITQTIGYSSTQNAPLELLQDILEKFMQEFARDLHGHMEHANRLEPNLKDARLSLKSLRINVHELLDYIANVEPVAFVRDVPAFPVERVSHMNFLKPGSTETLTRPVHIFEYLPPMQPQNAELSATAASFNAHGPHADQDNDQVSSGSQEMKPKTDPDALVSMTTPALLNFPAKDSADTDGRTIREISSVVMTTGGYISPAIEGKLPEAFVPEIIERFKGLDAPPAPPPAAPSPLPVIEPKAEQTDVLPIGREREQQQNANVAERKDGGLAFPAVSGSVSAAAEPVSIIPKASKKSKKPKHSTAAAFAGAAQPDVGKLGSAKAQEKAQRKALKMYQKLSKSHNDSNTAMLLKKSKKHLNRGVLASLPPDVPADRVQMEKLLKKQAKQRQKQQQLLEPPDVKPFDSANLLGDPLPAEIPGAAAPEPDAAASALTDVFSVAGEAIGSGVDQHPLVSSIKLESEPDRNKLNIFKKLSKQKTPLSPAAGPSSGLSLFGNAPGGSPLISLPSGTTITPAPPAPALSVSVDSLMQGAVAHAHFPPLTLAPPPFHDLLAMEANKPKKRGRKPGGKNQSKPLAATPPPLLMQHSPKKPKAGKMGPAPAIHLSPAAPPLPMEPLNLSNVQQLDSSKHQKTKEKKERKKYKSKYDPFSLPRSDNFADGMQMLDAIQMPDGMPMQVSPTKRMQPDAGPYVGMGMASGAANTGLYPNHQPGSGLMPMLPLLSFPPRPGLIPGPGLFSVSNFGQSGVPLSPFIPFPGGVSDPVVHRSSVMEPAVENKPLVYCNVAPLVPDSMKLTPSPSVGQYMTGPAATAKPTKSATGNLGDPIEVSDDSDEPTVPVRTSVAPPPVAFDSLTRTSIIQPPQLPSYGAPPLHLAAMPPSVIEPNHPLTSPIVCEPPSAAKKPKKQARLAAEPPAGHSISNPTPFDIQNFMGSDKFSLAGGADLIPLSRVESGLAYSSQTVPSSSLTAGATSGLAPAQLNLSVTEEQHQQPPPRQFLSSFANYEDITITPANAGLNLLGSANDLKIRKLHKKFKKPKEGKIRKKKDKKDKSKSRERSGGDEKPTKGLDKKQKKDKKKDKQHQLLLQQVPMTGPPTISISAPGPDVTAAAPSLDTLQSLAMPSPSPTPSHISPRLELSPNQVPKLTLKLGGKSTPLPLQEGARERELETDTAITQQPSKREREREHSPELARFSPLVTGPPKPKQSETQIPIPSSSAATTGSGAPLSLPLPITAITMPLAMPSSQSHVHVPPVPGSSGWISSGGSGPASATLSASSVLLPQQLMLASKPIAPPQQTAAAVATGSPVLAASPSKTDSAPAQVESSRPSSYVDAEGNRIWICPACGKVDDGSAMIGCDGCDAWYHWICVGIQVAPKDNDDWFCRVCITKKKVHGSEKKKKRNKKK